METTGKNMDELLSVLKKLDQNTKTKTLVSCADSLYVHFKCEHGCIGDWEMRMDNFNYNTPPYMKGKTLLDFRTALDERISQTRMFHVNQNCSVLCYRNTDTAKKNGKFVVYMFQLDPGFPYILSLIHI